MGIIGGPAAREEPILVADLLDHIHHTWNSPLIKQLFDEQVNAEIFTIPISPLHATDQLV